MDPTTESSLDGGGIVAKLETNGKINREMIRYAEPV
jgi:hypothetical protein